MSLDTAIHQALLAALNSPEGQKALRRALEQDGGTHGGDDQTYTVAQVAELGGYSPETIVGHIISRNLLAYKPRGCREWRIRREDFRAWLCGGDEQVEQEEHDPEVVAKAMLARRSG